MPAAIGIDTRMGRATRALSGPIHPYCDGVTTRTRPATVITPANANHFSCWRSTPRERRNRTNSAATEASPHNSSSGRPAWTSSWTRWGAFSSPSSLDASSVRPALGPGPGRSGSADDGDRRGGQPGHGTPPVRWQPPVGEQQQGKGDEQSQSWCPGPVAEPAHQLPTGQSARHGVQRVEGVGLSGAGQAIGDADRAEDPAEWVSGSPSRDHCADQWKGDRQQHDPEHIGVRDSVAVEGLQDETKDAEGKARTAQQPGQAHDRPWRGPGPLVTAHRCLHATLGVPAHRQAPSTSASWSVAEASQTAVSAALRKAAQANRQAANGRPTPCNQTAVSDTQRQQTQRSGARCQHCCPVSRDLVHVSLERDQSTRVSHTIWSARRLRPSLPSHLIWSKTWVVSSDLVRSPTVALDAALQNGQIGLYRTFGQVARWHRHDKIWSATTPHGSWPDAGLPH